MTQLPDSEPPMYNLLDNPFIRGFYPDGSSKELGILDIFKESSKLARIGGDSSMQEAALLRLLLAITYRSLPKVESVEDWETLWEEGFPLDDIERYLERHRERFELLDSETPFFQIVGAEYEGKFSPDNSFLLLDYQPFKNDLALYSNFTSAGKNSLDFGFAARKLVELQAFNTGARKKIIKGDPRIKKRTYAQPGWLSTGSIVAFLGETLEKTLLLNFVPYGNLKTSSYEEDLPVWERPQHTPAPEELHGDLDESRTPTGPADLFTHQSSRVTLYHDGEKVTGTVVGIGDRIFKYGLQEIETMMPWKQITRETKEIAYIPVKQRGNDTWRSINGLLGHDNRAKLAQRPAGVTEWMGEIPREVHRQLGGFVPTMVFTSFYGAQDAIIDNQVSAVLNISMDALEKPGMARDALITGLTSVEDVVFIYRSLLTNIYVAEGKKRRMEKGTSASDLAAVDAEELLHNLGFAYKEWIQGVTNENALGKLEEWNSSILKIARKFGSNAVENASPRAIAGRREGENEETMNAFRALTIFEATLRKKFTKEGTK